MVHRRTRSPSRDRGRAQAQAWRTSTLARTLERDRQRLAVITDRGRRGPVDIACSCDGHRTYYSIVCSVILLSPFFFLLLNYDATLSNETTS
jgi:hypothetical protein